MNTHTNTQTSSRNRVLSAAALIPMLSIGALMIPSQLASASQGTLEIGFESGLESGLVAPEPVTEQAITDAIEEYTRARYAGDVETVKSRVHHDVARRTFSDTYWGQPSDEWVRPLTHDHLSFLSDSNNPARRDDPENGRCEIEVFDIAQRTAAASLVMDDAVEYLHMILYNGRWLIADSTIVPLNRSGMRPPATTNRHDETITKILTDYCVGFYELDGEKVQDTCHSGLSKRVVEQAQHEDFDYLRSITFEEIEILGKTFNKEFGFDPETARCEVEIYEVRKNMAIAKMTGTIWFDYFQLLKVDDEWTIVNIMFEGLPRDQWVDVG